MRWWCTTFSESNRTQDRIWDHHISGMQPSMNLTKMSLCRMCHFLDLLKVHYENPTWPQPYLIIHRFCRIYRGIYTYSREKYITKLGNKCIYKSQSRYHTRKNIFHSRNLPLAMLCLILRLKWKYSGLVYQYLRYILCHQNWYTSIACCGYFMVQALICILRLMGSPPPLRADYW